MLKFGITTAACAVFVTLLSLPARADDGPVERPSAITRPALPQGTKDANEPVERPATERPARTQRRVVSARSTAPRSTGPGPVRGRGAERPFLYLGAGLGAISGLQGGPDFQRTNPGLSALVGVEVPLSAATGLGFELEGDLELAGSRERSEYGAIAFRARLSRMVAERTRLWGALGLGRAGYESGSFAGTLSAGSSFLFGPRFGLDLSGNLHLVGAASDAPGVNRAYEGGAVLLFLVRGLFEFQPMR